MNLLKRQKGMGLVELMAVIVIIGILTAVAMQSMTVAVEDIREQKTIREMEMLSSAIVGDPSIISADGRSSFGYVGDIGSFPPDLSALATNPGYSTWDGPYLPHQVAEDTIGYKLDEWGSPYTYSGGTQIVSTGSGTNINKRIADATPDYLLNSSSGKIVDSNDSLPGILYFDSVQIIVTIPNGSGGLSNKSYNPNSVGQFVLDSLPVGHHSLKIIYSPNVDTLNRYVSIMPRNNGSAGTFKFGSPYFSAGGGGPTSGMETLRPEGVGSNTELSNNGGCASNWQCVSEITLDGDVSYVEGGSPTWEVDSYATEDHSTGSGTIDSVKIYIAARGSSAGKKARTEIFTNGTLYDGTDYNLTTIPTYTTYSTLYVTNPNTSSAWTWTEIDNMEIGIGTKKDGYVTGVWAEVYYTN